VICLFIKILTKKYAGKAHYYASLVENKRENNQVRQTVIAILDQSPKIRFPI